MALTDGLRLRHMRDASQKAQDFVRDKERSAVDEDEVLAFALVRLVEVVGEAAKGVSTETREKYPEIPWGEIAGTRNRIAHAYFDVNLDIVWKIATENLPAIHEMLERASEETPLD
jgi:uncharacterized protein with HEPN domain